MSTMGVRAVGTTRTKDGQQDSNWKLKFGLGTDDGEEEYRVNMCGITREFVDKCRCLACHFELRMHAERRSQGVEQIDVAESLRERAARVKSSTPQTSSVTVNRVSLPLGALIAGKITKVNLDVE